MLARAPRLAQRMWRHLARGALTVCGFWLATAAQAQPEQVRVKDGTTEARFEAPTDRYGHAIMGNLPEWGRLCLADGVAEACVTLPFTSVFEDIAPRLADVDRDGRPEAVVVESSFTEGAALVVYRLNKAGTELERIATPHIGTRNRWLAPAGIADLDGDGAVELAFVDRPHLAKRLRIWRYQNGRLVHVADAPALTNHRIGEPFISGGLRDCGAGPEIITADGFWSTLQASRLQDDRITSRALGAYSLANLRRAMACEL